MNKVACIFGGTKGIGFSVASRFIKGGYTIVVFSRNQNNVDSSVKELQKSASASVHGFVCDVADEQSVQQRLKETEEAVGPVHILVNSAGVTKNKLLIQTSQKEIKSVIDTNLIGAINTSKACLKYMMKRKTGSIVNIGSIVGSKGNIGQTAYSASKAGLEGFTKSLAKEVASRGIRVNIIVPGFILTDMTADLKLESIVPLIPLNKIGKAEDIAEGVYFLSHSTYVTGQALFIDGGLQLQL